MGYVPGELSGGLCRWELSCAGQGGGELSGHIPSL